MSHLTIVGVGPGNVDYITTKAQRAIQQAPVVFAAKRHAYLVGGKEVLPLEPLSQAMIQMQQALGKSNVLVIVSGDPTFFSLAKVLKKKLEVPVTYIAGISSVQMLFCALGEDTSDIKIESIHGRIVQIDKIITQVQHHRVMVYLTDAEFGPEAICRVLCEAGMGEVEIAVGENLSYDEERIIRGKACEIQNEKFEQNCVTRIINKNAISAPIVPLLRDEAFIRDSVPMTKEEIRMLSICKLGIKADSLIWDAGAGTGSVALQCAQLAVHGHVYAVERNEKAVELIEINKKKLAIPNISIYLGTMPECLQTLPDPTHVFIGGNGGALADILEEICKRGKGIRVVINAITLKTLSEARRLLQEKMFCDADIIQVQVNTVSERAEMLLAQNPIFIISATTG